jgi:hypothetical protein
MFDKGRGRSCVAQNCILLFSPPAVRALEGLPTFSRPADWKIGDKADFEICATWR